MHEHLQTLLLTALISLTAIPVNAQIGSSWRFSVLLDGKTIGEHRFTVTPRDGILHVRSEADMQVRFLFFDAYTYRHRALELWQGGCLLSIDAETDNNDRQQSVRGRLDAGIFRLSAGAAGETDLPGCIKSFSYWDSSFLQSPKLLNSQNGKLIDIQVTTGEWETIEVSGQQWRARRYTLTGEKLHIDLWYGPGGEWLRLGSLLPGGRQIDYRLIEGEGWTELQRAEWHPGTRSQTATGIQLLQ